VAQRHYLREILEREFASHRRSSKPPTAKRPSRLALKHKPDVSILDIQMPKLSGVKRRAPSA